MKNKIFLFIFILLPIFLPAQNWNKTNFPQFYSEEGYTIASNSNGYVFFIAFKYDIIYPNKHSFVYSTNNGDSWTTIDNTYHGFTPTQNFAFDSLGNVLIRDSYYMYRSTNNGLNWIKDGPNYQLNKHPIIGTTNYFFSIANDSLFISNDVGKQWNYYCKLPVLFVQKFAIIENNGVVDKIIINYTNQSRRFLSVSSDQGKSWNNIVNGTTSLIDDFTVIDNSLVYCINRTIYVFDLSKNTLVSSMNPIPDTRAIYAISKNELIISYDNKLVYSSDKGKTWGNVLTAPSSLIGITQKTTSGYIFASAKGIGVIKSNNNGETWRLTQSSNMPFSYSQVTAVCKSKKGTLIVGTNSSGILRSTDNGYNWSLASPSGKVTSISCDDSNILYSSLNSKAYKSTDDGLTWLELSLALLPSSPLPNKTGYFTIKGSNNAIYFGSNLPGSVDCVYELQDRDTTWKSIFEGETSYPTGIYPIYSTPNNRLIIQDNYELNGFKTYVGKLEASWNWTKSNSRLTSRINGFAATSDDQLFACSSTGLFTSEDFGSNWSSILNLPTNKINCVLITPKDHIFIGTENKGIFKSTDRGSSWSPYNKGLKDSNITTLYLDNDDLYAGCYNNGLFKTSGITSVENYTEIIPTHFSLSQNYPNPFNPETTIQYTIPASLNPSKGGTFVSLKVFDLLGREVVTLVDEYKQPGNYKAIFNVKTLRATSLPSGVFFYTLTSNGSTQTKKMLVIK